MNEKAEQQLFQRLRKYAPEVLLIDKKPLFGEKFSFPWESFNAALKKVFFENIRVLPKDIDYIEKGKLESGISSPAVKIFFSVSGIEGNCALLLSKNDIKTVMQKMLSVSYDMIEREDKTFYEQFYLFFLAQCISCIESVPELAALGIRIEEGSLDEELYYTQEVALSLGEIQSFARFVIPKSFIDSYRSVRHVEMDAPAFAEISLALDVEAGRLQMKLEEIQQLQVGEIVLLDTVFYAADGSKSTVFLTYKGKPVFRAKYADGSFTIVKMPLIHETFLPQGEMRVESIDDLKDEEFKEMEEPFLPEEEEKEPSEEEIKKTAISSGLVQESLDIASIPLTISVLLGKVQMSVKEISSLEPGNMIDLGFEVEDQVMLVANGICFARGTLVMIGDHVGVQLKEISKA